MAKKTIGAKAILADLKDGLTDEELMSKYGIAETDLRKVFKKLVKAGLMSAGDMKWRPLFWNDTTTLDLKTLELNIRDNELD